MSRIGFLKGPGDLAAKECLRPIRPPDTMRREATRKEYEKRPDRQEANRFYCSRKWTRLRDWYRARHPICEVCLEIGMITPTSHVHHKIPRRKDPAKALDSANLQAVCRPCHNAIEARRGQP